MADASEATLIGLSGAAMVLVFAEEQAFVEAIARGEVTVDVSVTVLKALGCAEMMLAVGAVVETFACNEVDAVDW